MLAVTLLARMAVDLHTHSTYSDGSDEPGVLVRKAASLGLAAVALTDHDTVEGLPEAEEAADEAGIELVRGTELSCEWASGTMHLVVLFLEGQRGPLQDRLEELRQGRIIRNAQIVERLRGLGVEITLEEVLEEAGEGSVGRPHFAAVMVRKGSVPDIQTAFDEYLGSGRPAYVGRLRFSPTEALGLARASGAVPVLAHPHTLGLNTRDEYSSTLGWLGSLGLIGVESFYTEYDLQRQEDLTAMTESFGLLPSGGSDYHGSYKEGIELGSGRGSLLVPDEVLDRLRSARSLL